MVEAVDGRGDRKTTKLPELYSRALSLPPNGISKEAMVRGKVVALI
jgi:hypothetical protein